MREPGHPGVSPTLERREEGTPGPTMTEERQIQVINQSLAGRGRSSLSEIIFPPLRAEFPHPGHYHATGGPQYDGFIHKEIL